jgi:hypothetical protein
MCRIIVINRGENEVGTPREFLEHFGFMPANPLKQTNIDECLCQFDIEGTFKRNNIPFKISDGDIYVGMLDEVMGDDDNELDNLTNNFDTVIVLE